MSVPFLTGPGFFVEDLGLATAGYVTAPAYFDVGDPIAPGSASAVELLGRFYGVDLRFGLDLIARGSGDLQRTAGLEALKANFARELVIAPGGIFWRPDYGIGLVEFLNKRATAENIAEMKRRIQVNLMSDPAVEDLTRLDVFVVADGLIEVFVDIRIAGQVQPIALGIGRS